MTEQRVLSDPMGLAAPTVDSSASLPLDGDPDRTPTSGVGLQLRAARESRTMSIAEAAQALKLAPRQVEALEAEDWAALPGNTMIRGFVRNYARLLGLDSDYLMQELDAAHLQRTVQLDVSEGTKASLPQRTSRAQRRDYLAIVGGLVALGLAIGLYFFPPPDIWLGRLNELVSRREGRPAADPPPVRAEASPPPQIAAVGQSVTALAAPHATVLSDQPAVSATSVSPAPGVGEGLRLSFAQPAWAEVRDGQGRIVFAGLSPAGSQRVVEGQRPLSLVVGNSRNVTLEYQGRTIDLAAHSQGDVARLTVE